uniref:(northern house mosquito) hypothetical protein n=1 Tax=Culex pipiens TaxID=7175 RepID=A0A8D8B2X8_CULPI
MRRLLFLTTTEKSSAIDRGNHRNGAGPNRPTSMSHRQVLAQFQGRSWGSSSLLPPVGNRTRRTFFSLSRSMRRTAGGGGDIYRPNLASERIFFCGGKEGKRGLSGEKDMKYS